MSLNVPQLVAACSSDSCGCAVKETGAPALSFEVALQVSEGDVIIWELLNPEVEANV